jgi:hypothetical protein
MALSLVKRMGLDAAFESFGSSKAAAAGHFSHAISGIADTTTGEK